MSSRGETNRGCEGKTTSAHLRRQVLSWFPEWGQTSAAAVRTDSQSPSPGSGGGCSLKRRMQQLKENSLLFCQQIHETEPYNNINLPAYKNPDESKLFYDRIEQVKVTCSYE